MKNFKRDISLLLVFALIISSLSLGFGRIKVSAATDAAGNGVFRLDVRIEPDDTNSHGAAEKGTDSGFTLYALNASGGVVSSVVIPSGALTPNPLENGQTTSFTCNGANFGTVNYPIPGLATMAVNKTITQFKLQLTTWVDNMTSNWWRVYYSTDGGSTYTDVAYNDSDGQWDNTSSQQTISGVTWFTNNVKTLTFDANGGSGGGIFDAIPGQTITSPSAGTRIGYTLSAWSPSVPVRMPNANSTYMAQWSPNTYTVNYNGNGSIGGSTESSTHTYDSLQSLTLNGFTKAGYTFIGWATSSTGPVIFTDGQSVLNLETSGSAVNLYAIWRETNPALSFDSNGGSAVESIAPGYNNSIDEPANPVKDGFNFGGWYMDQDLTTPIIWPFTVTQSTVFYAKWNAENYYTIIFAANGGTGGTSAPMMAGDPLTAPTVARTGYALSNWSPTVPATVPAKNTIYTAQWTANTYTVSYDGNSNDAGSTVSSSHTYDISAALTSNGFTKIGNSFLGWSTNPSATTPAYTNGQNVLNLTPNQGEVVTFFAVWSINHYTITFNADSGSGGTSSSMLYGAALSAPTVTKTGYTFASWSPSVPLTVPAANTTFTAQWAASQYAVTFNAQGGTVSPASSTVTYNSTYGAGTGGIPTPTKTGYTFGGWYTSTGGTGTNILSTNSVTITAAQTLYAKWTAITYTVSYNGNGSTSGSTANSTHTYNTAKALTASGFTKTGYAFIGWATSADGAVVYSDGQSVSNLTATSGATVTLYAKWTNVNVCTVTFDASGGTGGTSTTLIIGSTLTAPTVTKTGYTFAGWSPSVPATAPAVDTTYMAQWTAKTYTVTFNPQSGTVSPTSSTVTYNSTYGEGTGGFPIPTRTGYAFGGWFTSTGGAGTNILSTTAVTITAAQTLYAKWIPVISVTITFDATGGTGGTSSTMAAGDPLTAPTVTETGYTFTGWSPEVPATVPAANTTYTAQWSINSYTITFNANGGTGGTSGLLVYGSVLTAPAVIKTGYTFNGWSPAVPATVPAANTTYTAIWGSDLDFAYTVSNSQATITKYNGAGGNVVIPDTLGGYPVTGIGRNAFANCSGLTTLKIGRNVSTITRFAFGSENSFRNSNLTQFTVDSGNSYFAAQDGVLFNYTKTTLIQYPGSLAGDYVIPDGVTTIAPSAFAFCIKLSGVVIPDSVTFIGDEAFYNCSGLTSLILGKGITTIETYAFSGCQFTSVSIPGSVASFGQVIFYGCDRLTSVTFGSGITQIPNGMFSDCSSLTSVSIPNTVKTIDSYAFNPCTSLASITLPNSITSIGDSAFRNDTVLSSVYFYGDPPDMGTDVFNGCPSGLTIYHLSDKTGFTSPTWYGYPTAVFSPTGQYTITFDANGGTGGSSALMQSGATLTAPAVTKTGYTFTGWSPDVPAMVPASDATYTAQWSINSYTITFNANSGSAVTAITQNFGTSAAKPTDPVKTGYAFTGWYSDAGLTTAVSWPYTLTANVTFYAKWDPLAYYIYFNANGGTGSMSPIQITGGTVTLPFCTFTRTGYFFIGWATSSSGPVVYAGGSAIMVSASLTLYAKWSPNLYTIVYDANGGTGGSTANSSHYYDTAQALQINGYTKVGYNFAGWATNPTGSVVYSDGQSVINSTTINGDTVTLYAKWIPIIYTIAYDANGGSGTTASSSLIYDEYGTLTTNGYTKTGYTFAGWATSPGSTVVYTDGQSVQNLSSTNGATVMLYAVWSVSTYTVTFDPNFYQGTPIVGVGLQNPVTYTFHPGDDLRYLAPGYYRTGYDQSGWSPQIPAISEAHDYYFLAQWTAKTYTVTFDSQGGSVSPTYKTVIYASTYGTLPTPTKTGYTFNGWYTGAGGTGTQITSGSIVLKTSSQTLYAQWTANTYIVTFDAQAGSVSPSTKEVTYNNTYGTLPTPTKTGYSFNGWYTETGSSGTQIISITTVTITSDQILYAKWSIAQYTVSFHCGSGYDFGMGPDSYTCPAGTIVHPDQLGLIYDNQPYGSQFGHPPQKDGDTFMGWAFASAPATAVHSFAMPASNVTLYAIWESEIQEYRITFDATGGTGGTSTLMNQGDPLTAPTVTKTGYAFSGWSPSVPDTVPAADATYTAQWVINQYTLFFESNGGSSVTSKTQNYNTLVTKPTDPTKTGYTFTGWYSDAELTTAVSWPYTLTANVTFYAKWDPLACYVYFNANGASGSMSSIQANGGSVTLPPCTFTKTGYVFIGWATSSSGSVVYTDGATIMVLATLTLYAKWTRAAADYSAVNAALALANAAALPVNAAHDPDYMVDGLLYTTHNLTNGGYYDRSMFTESSLAALSITINWNLTSADQTTVDGYTAAIMTAYNNLELAPADYSELNSLVNMANSLNRDYIMPDSLAQLDAAIVTASDAVSASYKLPLKNVADDAAMNLANALGELQYKTAEYMQVEDAIKSIPDNDSGLLAVNYEYLYSMYTENSVDNLKVAVNEAYMWLGGIVPQIYPKPDYALNLRRAIAALEFKDADYTGLGLALQKTPAWLSSYYTEDSYSAFMYALNMGSSIYTSHIYNKPDQDKVDSAAAQINSAFNTLVLKTVTYTVKYQSSDGTTLLTQVIKNATAANLVTENAPAIAGYTPALASIQQRITGTDSENVITFTYNKDISDDVHFVIGNATGYNGDIITVSVVVSENSNMAGATFELPFDPNLFEYVSAVKGDALENGMVSINYDETNHKITATYISTEPLTAGGCILNVQFRIKADTSPQTINTNFSVTDLVNKDCSELPSAITQGTIGISLLGDINCDGKIDVVDALMTLHHVSGYRLLSDSQKLAADVDRNGIIDIIDALKILHYASGTITSFS